MILIFHLQMMKGLLWKAIIKFRSEVEKVEKKASTTMVHCRRSNLHLECPNNDWCLRNNQLELELRRSSSSSECDRESESRAKRRDTGNQESTIRLLQRFSTATAPTTTTTTTTTTAVYAIRNGSDTVNHLHTLEDDVCWNNSAIISPIKIRKVWINSPFNSLYFVLINFLIFFWN